MTKNTGTDFALLDPRVAHERGKKIQLKHRDTGEPLETWITVRGSQSQPIQQFLRNLINDDWKRDHKLKLMALRGLDAPDDEAPTIEEKIEVAIARATAATITWEGVRFGNEQLECTPANCRRLYEIDWVRGQVLDAVDDEGNFSLG